jgi:hypothetical protein
VSQRLEILQRASLVATDELRVADDIGHKNRGEAALLTSYSRLPPSRECLPAAYYRGNAEHETQGTECSIPPPRARCLLSG